jgi:hypothetical protein
MAYTVNFFGWCTDQGHDKVWGYVTLGGGELYNFWGKRGAKFTFQEHPGSYRDSIMLQKRAAQKVRRRANGRYDEIDVTKIETVIPGFYDEFEKQLMMAKLFDNFFGKKPDEKDDG